MSIEQQIVQWHHDRNLINGTTSQKQAHKALEEFTEFWAAIHPELTSPSAIVSSLYSALLGLQRNDRIKPGGDLGDAIGDVNVVFINIAEREGLTLTQCLERAYDEIKDRKGRMVDGTFVKESDL
jgi:hypothetical protein